MLEPKVYIECIYFENGWSIYQIGEKEIFISHYECINPAFNTEIHTFRCCILCGKVVPKNILAMKAIYELNI